MLKGRLMFQAPTQFKIDFIVWKRINLILNKALRYLFKIDFIVWKQGNLTALAPIHHGFKIDFIVWKL